MLIILYDDTGLAAWSPFGGRINMPTLQKLADNGLMYSQWHTTALCSPTRSTFLTGRNHHQNGFACISEGATGYPGSHGHIPMECAYISQVLRERGWNTYWLGKNHNVAVDETNMGSSKQNWPCMRGFDRFYGFLGGETDQYYPTLVEDNHFIEQPYGPEDGYHLSKDLADKTIEFLREKAGQYGESLGKAKLYVDDKVVAEGPMRAQVGHFGLCGEGFCVGRDSGDAVSREYTGKGGFHFTGGEVVKVGVYLGKEGYKDLEMRARAMMARE